MKALPLLTLLTLYVVCGFSPSAQAEAIRNFTADITINRDASVDVVETINMDFATAQRHGIYCIIPVQYSRHNTSYTLPFTVESVSNDGAPAHYVFSHQGHDVIIKIGDSERTLTGLHTYKISYKVRRALNFFDHAPELYWNVTGDQWPYPITNASAFVHVPRAVASSDIKAEAFVGPPGSTEQAKTDIGSSVVQFSAPKPLQPGDGLTIVVGLPAASVVEPRWWQQALEGFVDWWPAYLIPLVTFLTMYLLWWHSGRDQDANQPIAVEWNPPKNLSPAEVGTLVDESCDMEDIVSTLIDLAARGHLKIAQTTSQGFLFFTNKDYEFTKTEPPAPEKLTAHELEFLQGIFSYSLTAGSSSSLSSLKEQFYTHLPAIKRLIYEELTNKGLFLSNPDTVRIGYRTMAFLLVLLGLWLLTGSSAYGIGTLIAALIVALFARAMPARSAAGSKALRQCLGFARFVRLAEKDRIRVLAKEDPTIFGRLLPYAMVLGAADQWASAFEGLLTEPPDWYQTDGYGPNSSFSSSVFVNDLGNGMNTMRSTFGSVPSGDGGSGSGGSTASSGGSGFSGGSSGGGFGGGGGGSW